MKISKYLWLLPALYVSYMFGGKIAEGFAHSEEFITIISVLPFLKPYAYSLTPLVGLFDFSVALALIFIPLFVKNVKAQSAIFVWVMLWPFLPSSIRYFTHVADFEIVEVLSISLSAVLAYFLWYKFTKITQ